jgi:hypothetical protein
MIILYMILLKNITRLVVINMTKKEFIQSFNNILNSNSEYFYTLGSIKKDYEYITGILKHQGYYSGVYSRFYFNDKLILIDVKDR